MEPQESADFEGKLDPFLERHPTGTQLAKERKQVEEARGRDLDEPRSLLVPETSMGVLPRESSAVHPGLVHHPAERDVGGVRRVHCVMKRVRTRCNLLYVADRAF